MKKTAIGKQLSYLGYLIIEVRSFYEKLYPNIAKIFCIIVVNVSTLNKV